MASSELVNVYFIHDERRRAVKVGCTVGRPTSRLAALQTGNSDPLHLIDTVPNTFRTMETRIHALLRPFRLDGGTEWFAENPAMALKTALQWHRSPPHSMRSESSYSAIEEALAEIADRTKVTGDTEAATRVALVCDVLTERLGELLSTLRLPAVPLKGWLLLDGMHLRADSVGDLAGEVRRSPERFPDCGSLHDHLTRFPQRSTALCQANDECFEDVQLLQPYSHDEPAPWTARLALNPPPRRKRPRLRR